MGGEGPNTSLVYIYIKNYSWKPTNTLPIAKTPTYFLV